MTNSIPKFDKNLIQFETQDENRISEVLEFIKEWNDDTSFFYVKTSGSTGKPKDIKLNKSYALQSALKSVQYFRLKEGDVLGLCLSTHTIGGKMQALRSLISKTKLIVLPNSSNPLENINFSIDFLTLVPFQVQTIIQVNREKFNLVNKILIGGAKVSEHLKENLLGIRSLFYESYGMTETYSHVAIKELYSTKFEALNGVTFNTKNNCLVVNAPYLGISNLVTNDCVECFSNTSFKLLGRLDFAINSGGLKFHPELIEKKLELNIQENFFIIGEPHESLGECISLFIESAYDTQKESQLKGIFDKQLDKYEKPKKVYFLEHFIYTESSKINKLETQKLAFEK